jgi:cell wall-active antibiotic response 4TMS protein YvqF
MENEEKQNIHNQGNSRIWTGIILLIIGGFILARNAGVPLPEWIFNWGTLLMLLGFYIGMRHRFHGIGWLVMFVIGAYFSIENGFPSIVIQKYTWPLLIIFIGLIFILRPARNKDHYKKYYRHFDDLDYWKQKKTKWEEQYQEYKKDNVNEDDYIDVTNIFSGIKKNVLSKNFKGGDAVSILGGTEINLSQADITGRVVLELTQVLGGTKLIVPPHWDVRAEELISIFGGVEDKRPQDSSAIDHTKVLILKGTSVFGGIEIRSF